MGKEHTKYGILKNVQFRGRSFYAVYLFVWMSDCLIMEPDSYHPDS